jgi:hypothetical protein
MAPVIKELTPKQKAKVEKAVKLTVKKYKTTLVRLAAT